MTCAGGLVETWGFEARCHDPRSREIDTIQPAESYTKSLTICLGHEAQDYLLSLLLSRFPMIYP